MIDAAIKALEQMVSPPFRAVLLKSAGLAVLFLIGLGVALDRLLIWLSGGGGQWFETTLGPLAHWPVVVIGWALALALGLGLVVGAIFLMPAVASLVAGFFSDEIADLVERTYYPADQPGVALRPARATIEAVKASLLAILVYLCAVPFLLFAGAGAVIFFLATAYVLGRQYFELAAMRFHAVADAKAMRRANAGTIFVAGLLIAAFVSVPIVNLATPLFGMALMVHMHKRLSAQLIQSSRASGRGH
jgi:CysZ protein